MEESMIEIREATEVDDVLLEALGRLIPQLSNSSPAPSSVELSEIVKSDASILLVAEEHGVVLGMMTLVVFRIPTGVRAWIEDVVVDEAARGRGVGEALNRVAIERACEAGARTIDLTSRPSREAANRLYDRLNFEQHDTNVYRLDL